MKSVRSEPSWCSPLPFRAYPNRSCGPLSAATLSDECRRQKRRPGRRARKATRYIERNDREASVYRLVRLKWIERITGVYEASITAVGQLFFQLLDGLANHAERRAGLQLVLDLDK